MIAHRWAGVNGRREANHKDTKSTKKSKDKGSGDTTKG